MKDSPQVRTQRNSVSQESGSTKPKVQPKLKINFERDRRDSNTIKYIIENGPYKEMHGWGKGNFFWF